MRINDGTYQWIKQQINEWTNEQTNWWGTNEWVSRSQQMNRVNRVNQRMKETITDLHTWTHHEHIRNSVNLSMKEHARIKLNQTLPERCSNEKFEMKAGLSAAANSRSPGKSRLRISCQFQWLMILSILMSKIHEYWARYGYKIVLNI